jgi:hypothetical protein
MVKKIQYTFGASINLYEENKFRDFVNTHGIFEDEFELARYVDIGNLKIIYENGALVQIREIDELNNHSRILTPNSKEFTYFQNDKHRINYLVKSNSVTNNYLGGDKPDNFKLPTNPRIKTPFQYLGKISKCDNNFGWLPFNELHLIYPLFSGIIGHLYLDYSDPFAPEIIDRNLFSETYYGEMDLNGVHKFSKIYLTTKSIKRIENLEDLVFDYWHLGMSGVPFWIQAPDIPRCPITGNLMKFVCQINSSDEIQVQESNLKSEVSYFENVNKNLKFWGSGELFIFLEPNSKIVSYLIQDT